MTFQIAFLVGGFGARLGALTKDTPKPLLPVAGRPFLEYLIDSASHQGAGEIVLIAGHLGEQVHQRYHGLSREHARLSVIVEPELGGTAGALRFASSVLRDEFILANGDTYFDIPLAQLMRPSDKLVRLALRRIDDVGRYGAVTITPDGTISGFAEKGASGSGFANGGVYRVDKRVLGRIPPSGMVSLEYDVFPGLARDGLVEGQVFDGFFIDIGVPEDLKRAQTLVPLRAAAARASRSG